jgi:pilus assembly protein CpaC
MVRTQLIRTAALTATSAALALSAVAALAAGDQRTGEPPTGAPALVAGDATSHFLGLGVGKSVVIELSRDVKDVLVADPKIANAVIRSARRAYIIGAAVGQTNIFFFDAEGRQISGFDIAVTRDLNGVRNAIKQALPAAEIEVNGVGEGLVLNGTVTSAAESQAAFDIATRLVEDGKKVVNNLSIHNRDQVMLKVTVAEVSRQVIKQLGINFNGNLGYGTTVLNFNSTNPFSALGQPLSSTAVTGSLPNVSATLQAMERAGVIRTLAEPTLTAVSGENATFLAGGEFPVPTGLSCSTTTSAAPICQPSIDFKQFGVSLTFTPVVLAEGRISLRVMTEVSNLSTDNALTFQFQQSTVTVPSILTRRADTMVEIPSGGSLAMAGMIQNQTTQQINGIPGLMQLPVLGSLFRSRDFINNQTELMVLVTPYVVHAVAQKKLSRPDDGFADASDPSTILMGHLNRIYGTTNAAGAVDPKHAYHGNYGFILD